MALGEDGFDEVTSEISTLEPVKQSQAVDADVVTDASTAKEDPPATPVSAEVSAQTTASGDGEPITTDTGPSGPTDQVVSGEESGSVGEAVAEDSPAQDSLEAAEPTVSDAPVDVESAEVAEAPSQEPTNAEEEQGSGS
jgi:hypothetical protein